MTTSTGNEMDAERPLGMDEEPEMQPPNIDSNLEKSQTRNEIFPSEWLNLVKPKIKEILNLSVDGKTQELVDYQIEIGGKKIRPALAIASCLVCGGEIEDVLYPAAGLEILHNYTLIHDDIIDNSNLRRGEPTAWSKFGKSIAQCVGWDYAAAIFQAANKSKHSIEISEIFARTLKTIADGEILDILFEQLGREDEQYVVQNRYNEITEKNYLEMINKKTASLIQACCEVGGLSAEAKGSEIDALKNYGYNLGIAFQVSDDILDIFGEEKEFGKKIGADIKERKLGNIVILYALRELSPEERENLLAILGKSEIIDKDIQEAVEIIKKTKAEEKASIFGKKYIQLAKESLKNLPQNESNQLLNKLADFVIERKK